MRLNDVFIITQNYMYCTEPGIWQDLNDYENIFWAIQCLTFPDRHKKRNIMILFVAHASVAFLSLFSLIAFSLYFILSVLLFTPSLSSPFRFSSPLQGNLGQWTKEQWNVYVRRRLHLIKIQFNRICFIEVNFFLIHEMETCNVNRYEYTLQS